MDTKEALLEHLESNVKVLGAPGLVRAFTAIDRADFIPEDYKIEAYEDYAVPVGFGRLILKPTTAAFMLELLDVREGQKVLVVGAASGWLVAMVAELVGPKGNVIGVEAAAELVVQATENLGPYGYPQARIESAVADDIGFPMSGPYDKILVTGFLEELSDDLFEQLLVGGSMVVPVEHVLFLIQKTGPATFQEKEYTGFLFPPLES